jgi:uncharacterized OB-fold protein
MTRPIAEGLFDEGPDGPHLIGATCTPCGAVTFPAPDRCPRCASQDLAPRGLSTTGSLWTFTVQAYPPKAPFRGDCSATGFAPFGLGYVELPDDEVIVEARLTESDVTKLWIGMPMQLVLAPAYEDADGTQVMSYAFAPAL